MKGQALVEFALILPLLLILVVGALDFGRLFFTKIVITNAAREGAYYLVTHYKEDGFVIDDAISAAKAEAENSGVSITDNDVKFKPESGWIEDESVEVTVKTTVSDLIILDLLENITPITELSSAVEMMLWR